MTSKPAPTKRPPKVDYAWAAGFIDGEGCYGVKRPEKHNGGAIHLSVVQVSEQPLLRLQSILGGCVNGPYHPPSHKTNGQKPHYVYNLSKWGILNNIDHLWPYMCGPKRSQYNRCIARINARAI